MSLTFRRVFINIIKLKCPQPNNIPASSFSTANKVKSTKMDELSLSLMCKQLAPPLTTNKYKGQAGRIGIIGGSLEYTGAPYFAGMSALRVGADLVHVFCAKAAAMPIKSYSPELIVHPVLDEEDAVKKVEQWLDRLHVILIGPGLGREASIFSVVDAVIGICREKKKPLVIDADGLFFIAMNPSAIRDYPAPGVILTPNAMEFARLRGSEDVNRINPEAVANLFAEWGPNVTILAKGEQDTILDHAKCINVTGGGSGRRCGGQGDVLGGALCTFYAWALQHKLDIDVSHDDRAFLACYAACRLVRECNGRVFKRLGRSMICTDMLDEIHHVFDELFEQK